MSSTPTFSVAQTFTDPFPTASPSNGPRGGSGWREREDDQQSRSASLYVYAFIATVAILLCLSAVIACRSLRARRQYRRMVEEAIRNGTYVPGGSGGVDLGRKPVLWEAWLGDGGMYVGEKCWKDVMPMSLQLVKGEDDKTNPDMNSSSPSPPVSRLRFLPFLRRTSSEHSLPWSSIVLHTPPFDVPSSHPSPQARSSSALASPLSLPAQTIDFDSKSRVTLRMRVSLLVAMPSPHPLPFVSPSKPENDDEVELPHLEVGTVDVEVASGGEGVGSKDV
ncbi:hypothetical protein AAF712_004860 [Marasmius tenuissimus]|uniref:Uncharacterized protein n=1 Tax=Marasmius tenuissimus TaxID=585030 RepID=A0ABR3A5C2_9AGAR